MVRRVSFAAQTRCQPSADDWRAQSSRTLSYKEPFNTMNGMLKWRRTLVANRAVKVGSKRSHGAVKTRSIFLRGVEGGRGVFDQFTAYT